MMVKGERNETKKNQTNETIHTQQACKDFKFGKQKF